MSLAINYDEFVEVPEALLDVGTPLAVTLYRYRATTRTMEPYRYRGEILYFNDVFEIHHMDGVGICALKTEVLEAGRRRA